MKNLTLLAAMAVCGVGIANAQYVGDPALSKTTSTGNLYDVVLLDNASIESLKTSGKTVQDLRTDDVNRFLYVWDNTFVAGDGSYPGVDMQMDGYVSFDVSTIGWSGAGFNIANAAADLKHFTDNTHFHCGLRSTNGIKNVALIIGDGYAFDNKNDKWTPAKISVGAEAFVDNGASYPLVRVVKGAVLDVAVDIRRGSPTFGQHVAVELSAENHRQFFIPRGFAHGFSVLTDDVVFQYKCDNFYAPQSEGAIAWDDAALAIDWRIPADKVILSEKDKCHPLLKDAEWLFDYNDNLYEE